MNPSDFDGDDGESLSFNELPPSVARRYAQPQMGNFGARMVPVQPAPVTSAQPMPVTGSRPAPGMGTGSASTGIELAPPQTGVVPVEQYRQQNPIMQPVPGQRLPEQGVTAPPAPPKDNSALLFLGATALLAGVGYWAWRSMEKDKRKMRVGPAAPAGQSGNYGDDDDGDASGPDEDDGEPGGPLDAYEDAGLDPADVDPHEEGGIKLVKG